MSAKVVPAGRWARVRRVAAYVLAAAIVVGATSWADDAGWFDARAVAVGDQTARAMLADVTRWDAATSGERRGVAERVERSLNAAPPAEAHAPTSAQREWTLLRVRPFGFDDHRHEVAVFLHATTGLEFSLIPGGTFAMGSPVDEVDRLYSEAQHEVTLTHAFLLARTECTQGAYERVMGTNPSTFQGPIFPVETVTWDDAQAFDAKAGLRLPTEAEWEFACRAGTTTRFWSGDEEEDLARVGWYRENLDTMPMWTRWAFTRLGVKPPAVQTQAVGTRAANPFGLQDVHGNAFEFCEDWYDSYPSGSVTDPAGPEADKRRVIRGGSWLTVARIARSAYRYAVDPSDRYGHLGFRPARSLPSE